MIDQPWAGGHTCAIKSSSIFLYFGCSDVTLPRYSLASSTICFTQSSRALRTASLDWFSKFECWLQGREQVDVTLPLLYSLSSSFSLPSINYLPSSSFRSLHPFFPLPPLYYPSHPPFNLPSLSLPLDTLIYTPSNFSYIFLCSSSCFSFLSKNVATFLFSFCNNLPFSILNSSSAY
jgi:hypothetical protein